MESTVRFQFTKFVTIDANGQEKEPQYGYRIFDEYVHYYKDALTWAQVRTIQPQDVLNFIEEEYDELYESVLDKGFYFNDVWVTVDETGTILS